jgi:hemerythrin-like domain-containing protein
MSHLLQRLRDEHRNFARLMRAVERELDRFNAGGRPNYELLLAAVDYLHEYAGRQHHPAEDLVYARLTACAPGLAERCGDLIGEHHRLEGLTERFLTLLREVLAESTVARDQVDREAFAFVDAHRKHMRAEDTRFFDSAEAALSAKDWDELAVAARSTPDPLFGTNAEVRFRELRRVIDALESEAANA